MPPDLSTCHVLCTPPPPPKLKKCVKLGHILNHRALLPKKSGFLGQFSRNNHEGNRVLRFVWILIIGSSLPCLRLCVNRQRNYSPICIIAIGDLETSTSQFLGQEKNGKLSGWCHYVDDDIKTGQRLASVQSKVAITIVPNVLREYLYCQQQV